MALAPLRSLLFTPADDERKLARAANAGADAVILDLEDAVVPAERERARALVRAQLAQPRGDPSPLVCVRVNALGTDDFAADVALVSEQRPDVVVVPKATAEAVDALAAAALPVIPIIETAAGLRLAFEIASRPGVLALLLGAVDLGAQLGLEARADSLELLYARSKLVVDSAAAGIGPPIDAVHLALDDSGGLARQAALARSLGLRGKACIHPAQVAIVNDAFDPRPDELDWARRVVAAAAAAAAAGRGAVSVDGEMVDAAVVLRARQTLEESERR